MKVPHSIWKEVFEGLEESYKQYIKFHCQSFTDDNKSVKWCPRAGCGNCIESKNIAIKDVTCVCGMRFCFRCSRTSHRPCDCDIARKWEEKNGNESENITWMIANTKPCPNPKCGKPIEKNQGCNHMTCS